MKVSYTATIKQPIQKVFDVSADPETQLKWDPGTVSVEKLTQGPLGKGSKYRGKFKGMGTVEYEFSEFKSPTGFTHSTKVPMGKMMHTFSFESTGEGTKFTQVGEFKPNFIGWFMQPMVGSMLKKRFRAIPNEVDAYLSK